MVKELVTADLQINLNNRPKDTIKVLKFMRDFAIEKGCTRVVVCGDVYEYRNPKPEEQKIFQQWVKSLLDKKVKVLLVKGNHDIVSSKLNSKNYYTFGEFSNLGLHDVEIVESGYKENKTYYGHFLLKGSKMGPANYIYEDGVTPEELIAQNPDCDWFFLGDVHKHQFVTPNIIYVGSPERENFGERNEEKGFIWRNNGSISFIKTPARKMIQVEEDWTKDPPLIKVEDFKDALVKVIVIVKKEDISKVDIKEIKARYSLAYSLVSIEYSIIEEARVRNELINESKTPEDCFLEYCKHFGFEKEVIEEGKRVLEALI